MTHARIHADARAMTLGNKLLTAIFSLAWLVIWFWVFGFGSHE